jgi:hypothetical protein
MKAVLDAETAKHYRTYVAFRERLEMICAVCERRAHVGRLWDRQSDGSYTQLRSDGLPDGPESRGTHQTLIDLANRRIEPGGLAPRAG